MADTPERQPEEFPDRSWDLHWKRQVSNGLRLTPAERLRWLETTMDQMRRWVGRAKQGRPVRGG